MTFTPCITTLWLHVSNYNMLSGRNVKITLHLCHVLVVTIIMNTLLFVRHFYYDMVFFYQGVKVTLAKLCLFQSFAYYFSLILNFFGHLLF